MPVTLLDLIVIGVMLISALLAMVRGFTREVLAIAAWVAAAVAALLLYDRLLPYVKPYIKNDVAAQLAAGGVVFIAVLIVAALITVRISDMILDSRIGAIDRTLGFVFGAARGLLLMVVSFIFFSYLVPEKSEPVWVKDAKSKQVLVTGRTWILGLLQNVPENSMFRQFRFNAPIAPEVAPQDADPDAAGAPLPVPTPLPPSQTSQPAQ